MYCSRCGAVTPDNAVFCANCGQSLGPLPPQAAGVSPLPAPAFSTAGVAAGAPPITPPDTAITATYPQMAMAVASPYAGFWLRLVAYIIDSILVILAIGLFAVVAALFVGLGFFRNIGEEMNGDANNVLAPIGVLFLVMIVFLAIAGVWIYYAWFESSPHQATLGKMALGLIVTDMQGRRITFARASGRFFAKFITGLIPFFIGYIMAGFTERKQALHDIIAGCLVLRRV